MIHYHGLPLWPQADMPKAFARKHGMVSFAHPEQIEVAAEVCQSIVLDNGAFTAWKSGQPYNFEGYIEWCERWMHHPAVDWMLIPDVIDGTWKDNDILLQKFMEAYSMNDCMCVPVWHLHEPLERLDELADQFPRVALGSSGEFSEPGTPRWWGRMSQAMTKVCDTNGMPRCKLHGLRMLDPVIFSHLPLSSADSCNVARNVGIDSRWTGPHAPSSRFMRAMLMMERIESHASAPRWNAQSRGVLQNGDLFG